MKKTFWLIAGVCAAATGFLVFGNRRLQPLARSSFVPEAEQADSSWGDEPDAYFVRPKN